MSNVFPPGVQLSEHYRVVRLIQSNAMGAVYEAEQLVTHTRAALKWLRFTVPGAPDTLERVARDAKAASALKHPHLAEVHAVVREGSSLFVVTELLSGEPLSASISPHLMARRERLRVICQAMRGIATAHAHGVVHRGIHPGNIFLTRAGAESPLAAKVLDFATSQTSIGLTAMLGSGRGAAATLGAHVYMAQEQLSHGAQLDLRTDIYSLGVIAYQALTGCLPYPADSPMELAVRLATTEPAPALVLCPEIPRSLDRVLTSALAPHRASRLPHLDELIGELEAFALYSSLQEQPPGRLSQTALVIPRRRMPTPPSGGPKPAILMSASDFRRPDVFRERPLDETSPDPEPPVHVEPEPAAPPSSGTTRLPAQRRRFDTSKTLQAMPKMAPPPPLPLPPTRLESARPAERASAPSEPARSAAAPDSSLTPEGAPRSAGAVPTPAPPRPRGEPAASAPRLPTFGGASALVAPPLPPDEPAAAQPSSGPSPGTPGSAAPALRPRSVAETPTMRIPRASGGKLWHRFGVSGRVALVATLLLCVGGVVLATQLGRSPSSARLPPRLPDLPSERQAVRAVPAESIEVDAAEPALAVAEPPQRRGEAERAGSERGGAALAEAMDEDDPLPDGAGVEVPSRDEAPPIALAVTGVSVRPARAARPGQRDAVADDSVPTARERRRRLRGRRFGERSRGREFGLEGEPYRAGRPPSWEDF